MALCEKWFTVGKELKRQCNLGVVSGSFPLGTINGWVFNSAIVYEIQLQEPIK